MEHEATATTEPAPAVIHGFKGFDAKLCCRGKQYEIGKTETHAGDISLCEAGLHFCENPIDVFGYYPPADSRYAEVETAAAVVLDKTDTDSKRVAKSLKIVAELGLSGLIKAAVKFTMERVTFDTSDPKATNTGDWSAATNTGDQSAATNTGDWSAATNTGMEGCAISLGIEGKAKGAVGCWLTLAEWKLNASGDWHRIDVQTVRIDGEKIKADVFYSLKNGCFFETE